MYVLPALAALLVAGCVMFIIIGLAAPRAEDQVQERLTEYGGRPMTLEEIELSQPFRERILKPLIKGSAQFVTRFAPRRTLENTRHLLDLAGNPNNWSAADFMGVRGLAAVIFGVLGVLLSTMLTVPLIQRIGLIVLITVLGYYLPVLYLRTKASARQKEIIKSLPDALDLLTISVEAGLGFDAATSKVAEKWDNELSRAFGRVIAEIRVGKPRREALRDMADRMEVPDMTSFVAAICQADQLGVSIAKVMRIQSEQMRIKRRQRAEEQAQKAPVKMMFPLVFLVLPALFIVILGPAALILKDSGFLQVVTAV